MQKSKSTASFFVVCTSVITIISVLVFIFSQEIHNNLFLISIDAIDPGRDFYASLSLSDKLYPYYGEAFPYPPIIVLFYYCLSYISDPLLSLNTQGMNYIDAMNNYYASSMSVRICYYSMTLITLAAISVLIYRYLVDNSHLKSKIILTLLTISFLLNIGFIIGIIRGNSIILALLFTIIFLLFYDSNDYRLRLVGLIGLSIAINIKPYTVIFSLLYVKEKEYKLFIKLALISLIVFFVPFLFLKGDFPSNIISFFLTLISFGSENSANMIGIKPFFYNFIGIKSEQLYIINIFYLGMMIIAFTRTSRKWISVLALSLAMIGFTSNYGYVLCFLLPSIMFFIIEERELSIGNIAALILFLIMLSPYYISVDHKILYWIRSSICNVSLMILSIIILVIVMKNVRTGK